MYQWMMICSWEDAPHHQSSGKRGSKHSERPLPTREDARLESRVIASGDEDVEKSEPPDLAGGNVECAVVYKNSLAFPQVVSHRVTTGPSNCAPRCLPKKKRKHLSKQTPATGVYLRDACYIIIHTSQGVGTTQIAFSRWVDEQNAVYPRNRILFGPKRNKVLLHAVTWMDLENTVLSERSQPRRPHIIWFHLCEAPRGKSRETKSGWVVAQGWEDKE